jgi:hypothetical protein
VARARLREGRPRGEMRYRLGVEDIEPGHWIAWVLGLLGCFSAAPRAADAINGAPRAIAAFASWRSGHGRPLPILDDAIEIQVEEVFHAFHSSADYLVNAFFADDQRPLTAAEVGEASWLLSCTRRDLLNAIERAPNDSRQPAQSDQDGSLSDILRHIAVAERWYFGLIGHEQAPLPDDSLLAIEQVRAHSLRCLPLMVADGVIRERSGERWSPRKVVRRTLWHERDHTGQIQKLLEV